MLYVQIRSYYYTKEYRKGELQIMIRCKCISKSYNQQKVLEDFSYNFKDTGFYLLFGESGSGKTTLLNVLAGHLPYEKGAIDIGGVTYSTQIDIEAVGGYVDYITQDANFIDYLSVYDNLALCSRDDKLIDEYLKMFGLEDRRDVLPGKLSGGEKQRVCLIRSLVQAKRIILLDEPTAALDDENKKLVFDILKKLKESVLIICSSHDEVAKEYADECIDFNMLWQYKAEQAEEKRAIEDKADDFKEDISYSKKKIGSYVRKWFKSPLKEKKSKITFVIVMMLAMLAMCLGDTPEHKFDSSIEYIYKINTLDLKLREDKFDYIYELYERNDIKEICMMHSGSVPDGIDPYDPLDCDADAPYDLAALVLPVDKDCIRIEDCVAYGRYMENEQEIMLTYDVAVQMGKPEELIGKTIHKVMYDGNREFTIVGIFRQFTGAEVQYMQNCGVPLDEDVPKDAYFISADYTNRLMEDKECKQGSYTDNGPVFSREFKLFFESYTDMMAFYEDTYVEPKDVNGIFFTLPVLDMYLLDMFEMMYEYMFPIAMFIMFMAVLFYYQTQKTELLYNKKIFVVFQYLGYSLKRVKLAWMVYSVLELTKLFGISLVLTVIVTYIANILNRQVEFVPFELFTYNIQMMVILFAVVIVAGIVNILLMLHKLRKENISENLVGQRDLL